MSTREPKTSLDNQILDLKYALTALQRYVETEINRLNDGMLRTRKQNSNAQKRIKEILTLIDQKEPYQEEISEAAIQEFQQLAPGQPWTQYNYDVPKQPKSSNNIRNQSLDVLKKLREGEKLSDFQSRMTMLESVDYESLRSEYKDSEKLQNEGKLEQVYLGATMIREHFSDVQSVSKEVLEQFHKFDPAETPSRKIRKLAASLRNVQYGRIIRENCDNWEDVEWKDDEGYYHYRLTE